MQELDYPEAGALLPREQEKITRSELAKALQSLRLWVRDSRESDEARRTYVLHPEDAAKDIFTSVSIAREKA